MIRIGFDVGGSKLAAIALEDGGLEVARERHPVPRSYAGLVGTMATFASACERAHGRPGGVGIAMPGMIGRDGELIRVVNLPWLEGTPLRADLERATGLPVRIANDANCFALSEARDGAAAGAFVVFGAILGTGVGGGIVVAGRPLGGANAIAGEWGHNPLPGVSAEDGPPQVCGCGRAGCVETWLNGAALVRDYRALAAQAASPQEIAALAGAGDACARTALERYQRRLAVALAGIVNTLDPDVIVLGGGLSDIACLYADTTARWAPLIVAPQPTTRLVRARFGPDSGLRGAAWLAG